MGFSRQEYWNGLPFRNPGDLPDPGVKPASFVSPALAGGFFTTSATWAAPFNVNLTGKGSGIKGNLMHLQHTYRKEISKTSLAVQRLRPCASKAGGMDLIPGQGTEIPHAMGHGHRNKNKQKK